LVRIERAKRLVIYQLHDLGLPVVDRMQDPLRGLAFDLLSSRGQPVVTGHADGVITIDLSESDDVHRTMLRAQLDEPYRTVVGHIRHEIGHYYWMVLVEHGVGLESFRETFGDERASYEQAVARHYREGPPSDWRETRVSAYASMHPWEDWAETFAHYLHIRDALQTAAAWGIAIAGPAGDPDAAPGVVPMDTVEVRSFADVVRDWRVVSGALNALNRSMGHDDPYPFDLPDPVIDRLELVHRLVVGAAGRG
ncbi:MAG: putative zinc-binding metallopeptidase, partial [Candidatus Limnocylindrales bacterium]